MIAGHEFGDSGTDLEDDAGALVAHDDRVLLPAEHVEDALIHRHVAGDHVFIGMAHAGGGELHQDLVGLRRIELDLLDHVVGVGGVQHCGPSSHSFPF